MTSVNNKTMIDIDDIFGTATTSAPTPQEDERGAQKHPLHVTRWGRIKYRLTSPVLRVGTLTVLVLAVGASGWMGVLSAQSNKPSHPLTAPTRVVPTTIIDRGEPARYLREVIAQADALLGSPTLAPERRDGLSKAVQQARIVSGDRNASTNLLVDASAKLALAVETAKQTPAPTPSPTPKPSPQPAPKPSKAPKTTAPTRKPSQAPKTTAPAPAPAHSGKELSITLVCTGSNAVTFTATGPGEVSMSVSYGHGAKGRGGRGDGKVSVTVPGDGTITAFTQGATGLGWHREPGTGNCQQ